MITRRILLYTPILLIMLLLQSYFWVPTYEQQTRGNPERFGEYFTASIGDATLLNPILSADASSSEIEAKVFEGLIDYDENLRFRGRLATAWKVYEEAFFYVNETADIPGLDHPTPAQIADFLESARLRENLYPPQLQRTLNNISEISLIPPRKRVEYKQLKTDAKDELAGPFKISVSAPARIKLVLNQVDQDLFNSLADLLGKDYFANFKSLNYLETDAPLEKDQIAGLADQMLPAVEHNPVIEFYLRPDVKFHDEHVFDAQDVQFTFE